MTVGMMMGLDGWSVPATVATTTWNPSDKDASVGLSGGNLIATEGAGSGYDNVRAVANASSGKKFYQVTLNSNPSGNLTLIGVANAILTLSDNPSGLLDANAQTCDVSNGSIFVNGVAGSVGISATTGDVISIAHDLTAKLVWYRVNSGNWNNNASADPATGALGFDISAIDSGPYYPVVALNSPGTGVTANFGGSSYSPAAPSGFGAW